MNAKLSEGKPIQSPSQPSGTCASGIDLANVSPLLDEVSSSGRKDPSGSVWAVLASRSPPLFSISTTVAASRTLDSVSLDGFLDINENLGFDFSAGMASAEPGRVWAASAVDASVRPFLRAGPRLDVRVECTSSTTRPLEGVSTALSYKWNDRKSSLKYNRSIDSKDSMTIELVTHKQRAKKQHTKQMAGFTPAEGDQTSSQENRMTVDSQNSPTAVTNTAFLPEMTIGLQAQNRGHNQFDSCWGVQHVTLKQSLGPNTKVSAASKGYDKVRNLSCQFTFAKHTSLHSTLKWSTPTRGSNPTSSLISLVHCTSSLLDEERRRPRYLGMVIIAMSANYRTIRPHPRSFPSNS